MKTLLSPFSLAVFAATLCLARAAEVKINWLGWKPPPVSSGAVGRIKRAVQSGPEAGFGEGLALERELQQQLFQSDDAREGIRADLEKRPAVFTGR
jgi:enoyl-CoA hydratase/carnithine racemase